MCSQDTSSATPWMFCDNRDVPSTRAGVRVCVGALHCNLGVVALYLFRVAVRDQNKLYLWYGQEGMPDQTFNLSSAGLSFRFVREKCVEASHQMTDTLVCCPS